MRGDFFFSSAAPVMSNDNYGLAVQFRKSADNCRIVSAPPVSVKLQEPSRHMGDVVSCGGAPQMSRQAHFLPRRKPLAFYIGRQTLCARIRGYPFAKMS